MSVFYELLQEKATNSATKDQIIYAEMPESIENSDYKKCLGFSYHEFYKLVNIYIEQLKINPLITSVLFVDNSVASTAMIFAMRAIGMTPILIDISSRHFLNNIPAPLVYMGNSSPKTLIDYFVQDTIISNISEDIKGDIVICSSGSEGKPHFNVFTEDQLLNIKNQYGEDGSTFYSYISSANISGVLTNIINPILHGSRAVMRTRFDLAIFDPVKVEKGPDKIIFDEYLLSERNPELIEQLYYGRMDDKVVKIVGNKLLIGRILSKTTSLDRRPLYRRLDLKIGSLEELGVAIDSMMFPRDIVYHLRKYDCSNLDFSNLKHIYLAGGVNSKDMIDEVRKSIPSLNKNVLINLYGATEAGGVICSCPEDELKSCYIDASNSTNGEIIYTFDKINFYSITKNGVKKVDMEFNDETFIEFLPTSETKIPGLTLKDDFTIVFNDAEGKNQIESTDVGAYINNQLYVIGRKSSLVKIEDKTYFLSSLEEYFSRQLGASTYCILTEDNHFAIFIDCVGKDLDYKLNMYDKALKFCNQSKKLKFNYPVILDDDSFPKIEISGKISRSQFSKYRVFAGRQHFNFKLREKSKKDLLAEIVDKYFKDYEVTYLEDYKIKINVSKQYFFDLIASLRLFDVVSFNDRKAEIVLRFNDNYIFDISTTNSLLEFSDVTKLMAKSTLMSEIIMKGLPKSTQKRLCENPSLYKSYKEIDSKMSSSEIIDQLRINIAVSIYDYLPYPLQPFLLKGVLETINDRMKHGLSLEGAKEMLSLVKGYIEEEALENAEKVFARYFDDHLYAPNPNFRL